MASLLAYLKSKLLIPEEKEEVKEIQEDLTQRILHYNAIKKLSQKISLLPAEGNFFFNVNIKNNFVISNKVVPKISLQDLILKYSEIFKKKIQSNSWQKKMIYTILNRELNGWQEFLN